MKNIEAEFRGEPLQAERQIRTMVLVAYTYMVIKPKGRKKNSEEKKKGL